MSYDFRTARLRATKKMPYVTKGLMSMMPMECKEIPTMATDHYLRIYYNPEVFNKWTMDEAAAVILHEYMHCLMRHDVRARVVLGEKPAADVRFMWNIAADISINFILEQAHIMLPDGCMRCQNFWFPPNLTTEEYYRLLQQQAQGGGGSGIPQDLMGEGSGEASGSMSDGVPREWEDGAPEGKGKDGKENAHGLCEYERKRLDRIVAGDIAAQSRSRGDVPGGLTRLAKDILVPRFDPRREILAEIKYAVNCTKGFGGSTWKVPSRRNAAGGMRIPASVAPIPKPLIIMDTSGSMDDKDLALCRGVLQSVLKALPCPDGVRVVTGDTQLQNCQKAFSVAAVSLVGGGGTDMGGIMHEAVEKYPECDCVIVVSDGYTGWPSQPLRQKCLALLTRKSSCYKVPEWMRTVYIHPESEE